MIRAFFLFQIIFLTSCISNEVDLLERDIRILTNDMLAIQSESENLIVRVKRGIHMYNYHINDTEALIRAVQMNKLMDTLLVLNIHQLKEVSEICSIIKNGSNLVLRDSASYFKYKAICKHVDILSILNETIKFKTSQNPADIAIANYKIIAEKKEYLEKEGLKFHCCGYPYHHLKIHVPYNNISKEDSTKVIIYIEVKDCNRFIFYSVDINDKPFSKDSIFYRYKPLIEIAKYNKLNNGVSKVKFQFNVKGSYDYEDTTLFYDHSYFVNPQ